MLSTERRELLFFGYVRSNYKGDIPDELILLFVKWHYNGLTAIIDGDLLEQFLSIEQDEELHKKYEIQLIDGLCLMCSLIPNDHSKMVSYRLHPKSTNNESIKTSEFMLKLDLQKYQIQYTKKQKAHF